MNVARWWRTRRRLRETRAIDVRERRRACVRGGIPVEGSATAERCPQHSNVQGAWRQAATQIRTPRKDEGAVAVDAPRGRDERGSGDLGPDNSRGARAVHRQSNVGGSQRARGWGKPNLPPQSIRTSAAVADGSRPTTAVAGEVA